MIEKLWGEERGGPWFLRRMLLRGEGMSSIAFGPGSIDEANTADEWISISDLERRVEFLNRFGRD